MDLSKNACCYYVDEAGDPNLFGRERKILLGSEGVSQFFMLGLLQVDDPTSLDLELNSLRANLIADPYFKDVPSMQLKARKTALALHAKDDVPEVRKEVFSALMKRKDLRFFAIIRDKGELLSYVRQRNSADPEYKYRPNELYDYLIRRLFRDRLHTDGSYRIYFARRGNSARTEALKMALQAAQNRFAAKYHPPEVKSDIEVVPAYSKDFCGLQAVDYFLWALQRLFERGEDRYIGLLWPSFRLVIDMDDTRLAQYGVYYTQRHPINYAAIEWRNK